MSAHRILGLLGSQGLGCSPIKAVYARLGSERRETVRSLSGAGGGYLRGAVLEYERTGMDGPLVYLLSTNGMAE